MLVNLGVALRGLKQAKIVVNLEEISRLTSAAAVESG